MSVTRERALGADLVIETADDTPLVTITVLARGGAATDGVGVEGLHHHITELAVRGAGDRDRQQIDAAFDRLGTGLSVHTSRDYIGYTAMCLERNLEPVTALLADVLSRPRFEPEEHRKLLRETRSDLEEMRDDDADLAARFFSRFFWPGHPYARALEGNEETLDAIEALPTTELASRHRRALSANNLVLGIAGHLDRTRASSCAHRLLEPLVGDAATPGTIDIASDPPAETRVIVVDKPERAQTQVLVGHRGPQYASADGAPLILAETAFGGMFSSRLMQEVRVKRGWSYDTGVHLARGKQPSWIRMSLAPSADTTIDAIALVIDLYGRLCADGLAADELELARRYAVGSLILSRATARARVRQACIARAHGVADDYLDDYAARLERQSLDAVNSAIERHLSTDRLTIVVVGTASSLAAPLERFGPVTVVPYRSY